MWAGESLIVQVCDLPLQDLFAAGEGKFGTNEETFVTILGNRSAEHLREGEFVCARIFECCDVQRCNLSVTC